MKVLQINAVYEYSSTGRMTAQLHQYLQSKRIESYVAANNLAANDSYLIKIGNRLSRLFHSAMSHITGRQGHYSYFATKKLLNRINKINPDVVHLHVLHSNCLHIPLLLRYLAQNDIPTVITLHDCWFFTGHCCYFTDANCSRWKKQCGSCPELHTWNRSWFFDRSEQNLLEKKHLFGSMKRLGVVGISDWSTNFIPDSILKNAAIIRRIYNWIDLDVFQACNKNGIRKKLGLDNNDFIIIGVAQNWNKQKGILEFKSIATRCPHYKFLMVGNIPDEFYPLPKNIIVMGATSSIIDLAGYYSSADLFFNPSSRETFGLVTVEAQACGTPVVAYKLTATPELIPEGCGFIAEYQDHDRVIEYFEIIKKNGKQLYADNCRNFVSTNFHKTKQMDLYIDMYKNLIAI